MPEHRRSSVSPVYTNRTVSGNFRGPEYPQGFFGIQSMMDDVAYQLQIDPVEFALKNMTRMARDETPYTNYTLEECVRRGAELFDWKARWQPQPGSDPGPIKRGAGMTYMMFRSGLGTSSAVLRLDAKGEYTLFVGVTDVGAGAKTTMGLIAAEALGVPLSKVDVVWGDTDRCPYSVGESGSRTTIMTGYGGGRGGARHPEADRRRRACRPAIRCYVASASPSPRLDGKVRDVVRRPLRARSRSTPNSATCASPSTSTVHDSGRLMNPLSAKGQIHGAVDPGHRHGAARGHGLRPPHRPAAHRRLLRRAHRRPTSTRRTSRSTFIENDDGYGPFGAKSIGESGIILAPACVANAIFNAIGKRMKDLPITRAASSMPGSAGMKAFTNANARDARHAATAGARGQGGGTTRRVRRRRQRPAGPGEGPDRRAGRHRPPRRRSPAPTRSSRRRPG